MNMKGGKKQGRRSEMKEVKVKYISSPMKFQASASEFRALVQELTGQDSDAERFMEMNHQDQKTRSPSQQWKNSEEETVGNGEVTGLSSSSFPCHSSYGFQQGSEAWFDSLNQGFHFDMLSFDSMQSM